MHLFKYFAKYNANNREHQFWQQDNHPIALYSPSVIWQKLDYIHANPVRNGLVDNAEDYVCSSMRNYLRDNKNCLLEIDLLDLLPPTCSGFVYVPMDFR